MNKKPYALIYCRVSSVRQEQEGNGLESQQQRCEQYAESKGYEVKKVFLDSVSGGGDFMNRPAIRDLLLYADQYACNSYVVIFDDLKRFARDTNFHWRLRQEFKARGLTPECLNHNFDDTPEGEFVETILAAQGQLERKQNRRQVIQKQKARLESGYWPFFAPSGYTQVKCAVGGKTLTRKDPEATIIKEALEGFADNRFHGVADMYQFLKRKKFIQSNNKNHFQRACNLLARASIYAGYIEYKPWDVSRRDGQHRAIIEKECLEKIEDKLRGGTRAPNRSDINNDFPLRGFMVCGECLSVMTGSWSTGRSAKYPYYRCTKLCCGARNKSIRKEMAEKSLEDILKAIMPKQQLIDYAQAKLLARWQEEQADINKTKNAIEARIADSAARVKNLVGLIGRASNADVVSAYEEQIADLKTEEKRDRSRLAEIASGRISFGTAVRAVLDILKNPYREWDKGDLEHKRLVLRMVFSKSLECDLKQGVGTAELSLPIKVFEQIQPPNSSDVHPLGIEPRTLGLRGPCSAN